MRTEKFGMAKKNKYTAPDAIDRCPRTRKGTEASSPIFQSSNTNSARRIPETVKRQIIVGEVHGRWWPPHCIARNKATIEAMSNALPPRSSWQRNCILLTFRLGLTFTSPSLLAGSLRNTATSSMTTTPKGRFLTTHQHTHSLLQQNPSSHRKEMK
jgi:hypothetical protein